jgi:hypothetical protein
MASLEERMRRVASRSQVQRRVAERLANEMRLNAASHVDTGALIDSIRVEESVGADGVTRTSVKITRENLLAIENDHWVGDGPERRLVKGLGIVSDAVDTVKRGG